MLGHRVRNVNKFHGASLLTNINKLYQVQGSEKSKNIREIYNNGLWVKSMRQ